MKQFSEAHLRIGGKGVDPEICSEILGVQPDKQWVKGERFGMEYGVTLERRIGLWMYYAEKHVKNNDPYDPLPYINHIVQLFSGKRRQFGRIRNSMKNVNISISITLRVPAVTYTMDRNLLGTILKMGIDEMRYIFVGIEDEEETEMTMATRG